MWKKCEVPCATPTRPIVGGVVAQGCRCSGGVQGAWPAQRDGPIVRPRLATCGRGLRVNIASRGACAAVALGTRPCCCRPGSAAAQSAESPSCSDRCSGISIRGSDAARCRGRWADGSRRRIRRHRDPRKQRPARSTTTAASSIATCSDLFVPARRRWRCASTSRAVAPTRERGQVDHPARPARMWAAAVIKSMSDASGQPIERLHLREQDTCARWR